MSTKRSIDSAATSGDSTSLPDNYIHFTPLGSGQEVGRSCHILQYNNITIMLDCGIHPAYTGIACLPFFDYYDTLSSIDILLITHFHLDHCAALPYLLTKTNFSGSVYMTHPTKSIYKLILQDYIKVSNLSESTQNQIYTESDLLSTLDQITGINYHQTVYTHGIKFHAMNAGHVLGAAMFEIDINSIKILYTGDYSRKLDRHLYPAELPTSNIDILICESTYGVQTLQPVHEREKRFTDLLSQCLLYKRGKVLLPSFALGRAQELLLILDEYWKSNPALHKIPIYFASNLAKKVLSVYQTYINMMNHKIQQQSQYTNPFIFTYIKSLRNGLESIDQTQPCVVMASPGMLQNGLSREILESWCGSDKNSVIITGYSVEGTLAKHIMSEPSYITSMSGEKLSFDMSVNYISFSAHADYTETKEFIDSIRPSNIILVHGEAVEGSGRLMDALQRRYSEDGGTPVTVTAPKNVQTISLQFSTNISGKLIGSINSVIQSQLNNTAISNNHHQQQLLSGLLVRKEFNYSIVSPGELSTYTPLQINTIQQTQYIPYQQSWNALCYCISQMYDIIYDINELHTDRTNTFDIPDNQSYMVVHDAILIIHHEEQITLKLQWSTDPINDMIVDSIIAIIMNIQSNPAAAKLLGQTKCNHTHAHNDEHPHQHSMDDEHAINLLYYLREQYGDVTINQHDLYELHVDSHTVIINPHDMTIQCDAVWLMNRIKKTLIRANYTLNTINHHVIQHEHSLLTNIKSVTIV